MAEEMTNLQLLHRMWPENCGANCFCIFGLCCVMLDSVIHFFKSCTGGCFVKVVKKTWRVAPLRFMWCIWKERNQSTYDNAELGIDSNSQICLFSLLVIGKFCDTSFSFVDFLGDLSFVNVA